MTAWEMQTKTEWMPRLLCQIWQAGLLCNVMLYVLACHLVNATLYFFFFYLNENIDIQNNIPTCLVLIWVSKQTINIWHLIKQLRVLSFILWIEDKSGLFEFNGYGYTSYTKFKNQFSHQSKQTNKTLASRQWRNLEKCYTRLESWPTGQFMLKVFC